LVMTGVVVEVVVVVVVVVVREEKSYEICTYIFRELRRYCRISVSQHNLHITVPLHQL
jgi:hypothetical protein